MAADRDRGFTLVEVVIAIVLVGILSSVVVVGVGQLTNRGTSASCAASQDAARAAATVHLGATGSYPTTFTQMTAGSPPALTLPSGATVNATGDAVTAGGWTLWLVAGSGSTAPTFTCLDGSLWSPAQLTGVALWLDAAETSTMTLVGGAVSQWQDRSGNGRHLTPPAASNRPALTANGFNGRPTIRFDGADDHFGTRAIPRTGDLHVLAVLRPQNKSGQYHNVFDSSPLDGGGPMLWVRGAPNVTNTWELNTGGGLVSSRTWAGVAQVLGVSIRSSAPQLGIWVNGSSDGSAASGPLGSLANPATVSFFNRSGAETFLGDVSEMVWIDGSLTDQNRQRLEGYFAHKWGLAGSLPANHPFKSAPPTV